MIHDFEKSTFQNRPAYRYIREADDIPPIGSGSSIAKVKLFDPASSWTWYVAEYDAESREAFGLIDGHEKELGYFSMIELVEYRSPMGLPLERDIHYRPTPLAELQGVQ